METHSMKLDSYLESLPYSNQIKQLNEPNVWLKSIRENLVLAIAQADFAPLAVKWTKKLHTYLDMKYELSLEDRVYFIKLYYELIILPSMPPIFIDVWTTILSRLLKKKKLLEPVKDTLVLDWRPLYDNLESVLHRKQTAPQVPYSHTKSIYSLASCLDDVSFYFSKESIHEITRVLLPQFSIHRLESALLTSCLWILFVPTRYATREHTSFVFQFLSNFMNCSTLEAIFLDWFSRVALTQPDFPWETNELQCIYTIGLQMLDLPVGSSAVTASITSASSSSSSSSSPSYSKTPFSLPTLLHSQGARMDSLATLNSFLSKKKSFDPLFTFARFAVYSIHLPSSLDLLSITLRSITNFFHPSNSGKWTNGLTSFLRCLATSFTRFKHELETHRFQFRYQEITMDQINEIQPTFVQLLKPLVFYALFSKSETSLQSSLTALKRLVALDTPLCMPALLDLVYPALLTTSESHRTLACISALGSTAFAFSNPDIALNPETGLPHLSTLMFLVLPGMDVNDPRKTQATLKFFHSILISHPFLQRLEAMDWVVQFLNQLFCYLEQLDESNDQPSFSSSSQTGGGGDLSPLFYTLLKDIFPQLSFDTLYPIALAKVLDWCQTHFLPMSSTPVSKLITIIVKTQPHLAVPKFLNWILPKLQFEVDHETGSVATLRSTNQSSLSSLYWYLQIARSVVKGAGPALLQFQAELEHLLTMTFQFKDRAAFAYAHSIFSHLIQSLTMYQWMSPNQPMLVDRDASFPLNFRFPSSEGIKWAKTLVQTQLQNVTNKLNELCETQLGCISEFEVQHAFLTQISLLSNLIIATSSWKRFSTTETVYVDRLVEGMYEFEQLTQLLYKVYLALFNCPMTPIDLLESLVRATKFLIYRYGVDVDDVRELLAGYRYMKDFLRISPYSKTLPLALHCYRIIIYHSQRLQTNAIRLTLKESQTNLSKLMDLLLLSCQSEFVSLRKISQSALQASLKVYPSQKFGLVMSLLTKLNQLTLPLESTSTPTVSASELSPQKDFKQAVVSNIQPEDPSQDLMQKQNLISEVIQGGLHTLVSKPFMLACARNPTFLFPFIQELVRLTKISSTWKDKNFHPLLQKIVMKFMMLYQVPNDLLPPPSSLQSLLLPYLPKPLAQQSPTEWIQSSKETFTQHQLCYEQCVHYITDLLSQGASLHWRTMALALTFTHVFLRRYSLPLAQAVISCCTDDHPTIRKFAESCTREWLALVKHKAVRSSKTIFTTREEGYIDAFYDGSIQPLSQMHGYPFHSEVSAHVPPDSFPLDNSLSKETLLEPVRQSFCSASFFERIFHFHSLETVDSQAHSEIFYTSTALLAKQLASLVGPALLPLIHPHLEPLLASDEPAKVRCGVEWMMGLLRGTKHWPNPSQAWDTLAPLLQQMHKAGPELLSIWESGLRFLCRRRDPRRYEKLLALLWKTPDTSTHVFSESRALVYLKVFVNCFGPFFPVSFFNDLLLQLQPSLASPLKLVRTALAQCLNEIFQVLLLTSDGKAILSSTFRTWCAYDQLEIRKTLVYLFYLTGRHFKKALFQCMIPSWFPLVEQLVLDTDPDNAELGTICFPLIAQTDIDVSLNMPPTDFITVKLKRLQFFQIYIFNHLFYLSKQTLVHNIAAFLHDPSIEVRNLAGITLTGLFQCFPETQQLFLPTMETWLRSKDPILRHAGVLTLISHISMYPYSMPSHVPDLLERLASYMNDHLYIQTAVRKAFSEFKRTHMDTWHLDLQSMTGEQVALMSDVLASSSYLV